LTAINISRPGAKEPQPSADKNIRRTVENRDLNRISVKVILIVRSTVEHAKQRMISTATADASSEV